MVSLQKRFKFQTAQKSKINFLLYTNKIFHPISTSGNTFFYFFSKIALQRFYTSQYKFFILFSFPPTHPNSQMQAKKSCKDKIISLQPLVLCWQRMPEVILASGKKKLKFSFDIWRRYNIFYVIWYLGFTGKWIQEKLAFLIQFYKKDTCDVKRWNKQYIFILLVTINHE